MEYLGKLEETPERIENIPNLSKPEFTPLRFRFDDEEEFISLYSKVYKVFGEQGRCIVEDLDKSKYIIDIESINAKFPEKIDIYICGFRKIK
jgi:hypothetical protein